MKRISLKSKTLLVAFLFACGIALGKEYADKFFALQQVMYDWIHYGTTGLPTGNDLNNTTYAEAAVYYGCGPSGTSICAVGTRVSGSGPNTVTIYYP